MVILGWAVEFALHLSPTRPLRGTSRRCSCRGNRFRKRYGCPIQINAQLPGTKRRILERIWHADQPETLPHASALQSIKEDFEMLGVAHEKQPRACEIKRETRLLTHERQSLVSCRIDIPVMGQP